MKIVDSAGASTFTTAFKRPTQLSNTTRFRNNITCFRVRGDEHYKIGPRLFAHDSLGGHLKAWLSITVIGGPSMYLTIR